MKLSQSAVRLQEIIEKIIADMSYDDIEKIKDKYKKDKTYSLHVE